MKLKSINKILTAALSVSMLMGSTMPVLAADGGEVDVEAPIYSYDIIDVIVPTTYAVAFNPDGLPVITEGTTTSSDQILSRNYGIINKSSKDKVITVKLNVENQNVNDDVTFVDSASDVSSAADGEYKIHLTAIPADTTAVALSDGGIDHTTTATALNDVTMTKATADGTAVTLKGGDNYLGFKLSKATWTPKSGSEVTLGSTKSNDVSSSYEVTGLAASGASVTAFTFSGEMNANADWFKLTKGIKISAVYSSETAPSSLTAVSGTGAMVEVDIAPAFSTGAGAGQINYSRGAGSDGLKEIKKIEAVRASNGKTYDVYHAVSPSWPDATDKSGVITIAPECLAIFTGATLVTTVTYETNGGETKTATVDVLRVIPDGPPTFTTGKGIGQINYTKGAGSDGLKEIKKIEVVRPSNSKTYDVYNEVSPSWLHATDEAGVVTLDSGCLTVFTGSGTLEATVTYETNSGETKTAKVNINFS